MEFCKHDSCACGCEPYIDNLTLVRQARIIYVIYILIVFFTVLDWLIWFGILLLMLISMAVHGQVSSKSNSFQISGDPLVFFHMSL